MAYDRLLWILFTLSLTFIAFSEGEARIFLSREKALKLAFPGAGLISKESVRVTPDLAERIRDKGGFLLPSFSSKTVYIGKQGEKIIGYAIIDNVKGKSRPITYMLVIGPNGRVQRVEVLAFRESHGGEIRYPSFLKQFVGKSASDPIRNKRDIRNISGATISCRSISDGVRTLLILWEEIYSKGANR